MSLVFSVMQRPDSDPMKRLLVLAEGDFAGLAAKTGENIKTVYAWFYRGKVPADKVEGVCEAYQYAIKPHDLRPDIFNPARYLSAEK
jgi:uncharacterized membrane protein YkvA (DUF1232 family)